jgi:hypothetical protein
MRQDKEDEKDGVDDSQPQGNQDADGVKVWSVELRDKQIGALEAQGQGVHSLLNTLPQGESQEVEDLLDLCLLHWVWRLVGVEVAVAVGVPVRSWVC